MALQAIDFLQQMIAQGRVLDPSMSFEIGTPERKLITPVAQSLADNQVDMTGLSSALDIDSKFGTNLDEFASLFRFQRQQAVAATGFVIFSRGSSPAPEDILIPSGVQLQAQTTSGEGVIASVVQYQTTAGTTIPQGATESPATPIQCVLAGTVGNTAANTITQMVGVNVPGGVTDVTNPNALINGINMEDDDTFKTRFKNTWARNLAGTTDQYLALALAGISTKANVLGFQSRFKEYIQIPAYDDNGNLSGTYYVGEDTHGSPGHWTTALSSIPYAKQVYTNTQVFISSTNTTPFFYRPDVDFIFNMPAVMTGDVLRSSPSGVVQSISNPVAAINPPTGLTATGTTGGALASATYYYKVTASNAQGETTGSSEASVAIGGSNNAANISWSAVAGAAFYTLYRSTTSGGEGTSPALIATNITTTSYTDVSANPSTGAVPAANTTAIPATIQIEVTTGVSFQEFPENGGSLWINSQVFLYTGRIVTNNGQQVTFNLSSQSPIPTSSILNQLIYDITAFNKSSGSQPNFTFLNASSTNAQGLTPGTVVLSEFSYISTASRNDPIRNIDNAVDVYVDGDNPLNASTTFHTSTANQFVSDPTSPWYYENYRRDGQPTKRPQLNHYITPLFHAPLDSLPSSLVINNQTYYEGWHYWLVHELGPLEGSIRSRDGIEWNPTLGGDLGAGPPSDPTQKYAPTGNSITTLINNGTALEVDNYVYDANIVSMQAAMEASKQTATDVLAHKARIRYFALDITVVYSNSASATAVNVAIWNAVQSYFQRQYFGSVIQLSTLLEVIHSVQGVDNVRWSSDLPNNPTTTRIIEVDVNANPVHGASVDRLLYGSASNAEVQTLYIAGDPDGITYPSGNTTGVADSFTLSWLDIPNGIFNTVGGVNVAVSTAPIPYWHIDSGQRVSAQDIQNKIQSAVGGFSSTLYAGSGTGGGGFGTGSGGGIAVTEDTRTTTNVIHPIRSFELTYGANGTPVLPTITQTVTESEYVYDQDFFLLDNELPSLPTPTTANPIAGLTIRTRAQNTFYRWG